MGVYILRRRERVKICSSFAGLLVSPSGLAAGFSENAWLGWESDKATSREEGWSRRLICWRWGAEGKREAAAGGPC